MALPCIVAGGCIVLSAGFGTSAATKPCGRTAGVLPTPPGGESLVTPLRAMPWKLSDQFA